MPWANPLVPLAVHPAFCHHGPATSPDMGCAAIVTVPLVVICATAFICAYPTFTAAKDPEVTATSGRAATGIPDQVNPVAFEVPVKAAPLAVVINT